MSAYQDEVSGLFDGIEDAMQPKLPTPLADAIAQVAEDLRPVIEQRVREALAHERQIALSWNREPGWVTATDSYPIEAGKPVADWSYAKDGRQPGQIIQHELSTMAAEFDAIAEGKRTFIACLNDRNFRAGDLVLLRRCEYDLTYDGQTLTRRIATLQLGGSHGVYTGFCVLGFTLPEPTINVRYACDHTLPIPVGGDVAQAPVVCPQCMKHLDRADAHVADHALSQADAYRGALRLGLDLVIDGDGIDFNRLRQWAEETKATYFGDPERAR